MRTALNDYKIAKRYILDNYKFILNNRIQFYLDFNWKIEYEDNEIHAAFVRPHHFDRVVRKAA